MAETKALTIFEHLSNLTDKKKPWSQLREMDKKSFSPYLINRWLSMNPDLIELVNYFQKYTITEFKPAEVYKLYFDFLPKQKLPFNKYIKGKKETKYNKELIELLITHYQLSSDDVEEYIDLFKMTKEGVIELTSIIKLYGKSDKEIQKLLKEDK